MEAGKRSITEIFNKARTLEIPFFQRSYVWDEEDWERFADDMIAAATRPKGYFLGSIILKQRDTELTELGDARIVVDGQQRLTSLILLFRVACDAREDSDFFDQIFINLRGKLALKHNHNDLEVFEALAMGDELSAAQLERYADNRVLGVFRYFEKRKKDVAGIDPEALVNRVYFVGIDLGKDEDEQQIFDTINSLGVDLTTAELLKNELYDRSQFDLYKNTWLPAFEDSEEQKQYWGQQVTAGRTRRQNIDLFLQSFLQNQPNVSDDVRVSNLFAEYRTYFKNEDVEKSDLAESLTESAHLYGANIDPAMLDEAIDMSQAMERMNVVTFGLQTTTVLPYVLHILRATEPGEERQAMLRLVETFLIRRLVANETTKHYNRFFASLARTELGSYKALKAVFTRSDDPSSRLPDDASFGEGFQTTNLTNRQARVVLYLLEGSVRDDARHSTALAGFGHYTLEHVMPKKWRNKWDRLLSEEKELERDKLVRKLGNLTLLSASLNRSVRDSDWSVKKTGSGGHGGLKRYARGLEIFEEDLEEEQWTNSHIRERGRRLSELALEVWPYPPVD